ncbi:hypothetical protein [Flavobacterium marginilacus]|uniref:hypothetical protein n=1 Tax=Flavobacterium marginilacus TaxID=3003256 RepID=UPI00248EE867|nr:hypothetical protein [Flavobacterium marginilacus]
MNKKTTFSKKKLWISFAMIPLAAIATGLVYEKSISPYSSIPPDYIYSDTDSNANTCSCYAADSTSFKLPITFNNEVPGDLQLFNQTLADCFAWQEFIALNWPTNPSSSFGTPNDYSFVQWETYMPREVLFPDDGSKPPVWGTLVSDEYSSLFKSQKLLMKKTQTKLLTFVSKIEKNGSEVSFSPNQAAPFNKPSWLGAQNNTNVWYEIMLNKDYYDFIVKKGFYNAQVQHDTVQLNQPINFPQGEYKGIVGAIELKATWLEVPDPQSPKWTRYKLSKATVLDPITKKLRNTVVALVGLHILHKTQNQPTWVWATFEQIDNTPDQSDLNAPAPSQYGYNFYNAKCTNRQVTVKTSHGDSTAVVKCVPNTPPPYYLNQAGPVATQSTRINSIDQKYAAPINKLMQQKIQKFYPNSVWQYYELVDVIWSITVQPDPTVPIQSPRNINTSSMLSGVSIVANSTMETYVQSTNTCFNCHIYSTIAPYPKDSVNNSKFGDFSFAISFAKYPVSYQKNKGIKK